MVLAQFSNDPIDDIAPLGDDSWSAARYVPPGYDVSVDPASKLIRIAIMGFWDQAVMQDFARDLLGAVRRIDDGENQHVILCDLSLAVIQSQAVFDAFRERVTNGPTRARKLALFTPGLAMRMQVRRLAAMLPSIAIFASAAEAMAWLAASEEG